MDEDRRIRFLVSPILFVASLLLGALLDQTARDFIVRTILNERFDWPKLLIGFLAGGGIVVFALGYVIGTLTYFSLRLIFLCRPQHWGRFHEVALSDDAFCRVWKQLGVFGTADRRQELSAGVAFDHSVLRKSHEGVHRWLVRRWNAFSIATTSFCGLILSLPFGYLIGIPLTHIWWCAPVGVFAFVLFFVMIWSWRDTMRMVDFMTTTLPPERGVPHST
jgi:hypothetical protein